MEIVSGTDLFFSVPPGKCPLLSTLADFFLSYNKVGQEIDTRERKSENGRIRLQRGIIHISTIINKKIIENMIDSFHE